MKWRESKPSYMQSVCFVHYTYEDRTWYAARYTMGVTIQLTLYRRDPSNDELKGFKLFLMYNTREIESILNRIEDYYMEYLL